MLSIPCTVCNRLLTIDKHNIIDSYPNIKCSTCFLSNPICEKFSKSVLKYFLGNNYAKYVLLY